MNTRWIRFQSTIGHNTNALASAHLDFAGIVAQASKYRDLIERRNLNTMTNLEFILKNRPKHIALKSEIDRLRQERTKLGKTVQLDPLTLVRTRLTEIKVLLKPLELKERLLASQLYIQAEALPNLLDDSVPKDPLEGDTVTFINCDSVEDAQERIPACQLDHRDIGEELGIMDFYVALRMCGSSWYYLVGDGALLEQALVQYALMVAREHGYTMMSPPSLVRSHLVDACGFKPRDLNGEKQVYKVENEPVCLTGTAEVALAAFHSCQTFNYDQKFPVKYVGVSRAYRAEAGARGKDTRGLYRVHEFTKVELFHFTRPEKSHAELEQLMSLQSYIIKKLGLLARIVNMPTTDLGAPALKKYDCEAWMPGRGSWGELTSSSNCGLYQLRRLGIKYLNNQQALQYVNTLNGTAMAVPRVIVAIIEQGWDEKSRLIRIPPVLRPFMDGKTRIMNQF